MLTKDQKTKYLKQRGVRCPHCDSYELQTRMGDRQDDYIIVQVTCGDCGREWKDEYKLTGVFDVDDEDNTDLEDAG
jgi:DNA-directed RNA polymerase subunit RPC12/RpoP